MPKVPDGMLMTKLNVESMGTQRPHKWSADSKTPPKSGGGCFKSSITSEIYTRRKDQVVWLILNLYVYHRYAE